MKRLNIAGKIKDVAFTLMFISNWCGRKRLVDITDEEFKEVLSIIYSTKRRNIQKNGRSD